GGLPGAGSVVLGRGGAGGRARGRRARGRGVRRGAGARGACGGRRGAGGDRVSAAPARGELDRVLRLREVTAVTSVSGLHIRPPDRPGRGPAEAGALAGVGVADPDGRGELRRVADEPGVRETLGRPGLAGGGAAEVGVPGAGPLGG